MILKNIEDFISSVPPGKRLLALDLGEKRIGLALSDTRWKVATPLSVINRTRFTRDMEMIEASLREHEVGGLVVGYPLTMDGSAGRRCQSVRQFVTNLLKVRDMPVFLRDERLSTAAAARPLEDAGASRGKRTRAIDKIAACYILQGMLDGM